MKLDKFKGCVFFGKIQKRICDLRSMDSSASKKTQNLNKGLFSMTTETNKPRVACNLKKKKKVVFNWFVFEKFFNENATRKKIP